jgi:hypothetical protein
MEKKIDAQKINFCRSCNNRKQEATCKLCDLPLCEKCSRFLYFDSNSNNSMYRLSVDYEFSDKKPNKDCDAITSIAVCQDCLDKTLDVYSRLDFQKEIYKVFKIMISTKLRKYIKNHTW